MAQVENMISAKTPPVPLNERLPPLTLKFPHQPMTQTTWKNRAEELWIGTVRKGGCISTISPIFLTYSAISTRDCFTQAAISHVYTALFQQPSNYYKNILIARVHFRRSLQSHYYTRIHTTRVQRLLLTTIRYSTDYISRTQTSTRL